VITEFANDRFGHLPRPNAASQYNFRRMNSNQHENALVLARHARRLRERQRPSNGIQARSRCCPDDLPQRRQADDASGSAASPTKAPMVNLATLQRSVEGVHVSRCAHVINSEGFFVRVGIRLEDWWSLSDYLDGFDTVFATQILRLEGGLSRPVPQQSWRSAARPGADLRSPPWDGPVLLVIWRRSRPAESVAPSHAPSAMSLDGALHVSRLRQPGAHSKSGLAGRPEDGGGNCWRIAHRHGRRHPRRWPSVTSAG
jgi:hypothetical protein